MSRLGDLIRTERVRAKMTPKQVAKKCGVAESFIVAVEAGTRIIADDQARRILKTIGLKEHNEADFTLDDIAATVDLASVQPQMAKAVAQPKAVEKVASTEEKDEGVVGSVWLDALTSVLKHVPVMNAVMKPVDHKLLPIQGGK
ncbi:MAG: helix-turn-helix transcriptional regulator, partial [Clostridia bacterium]|nr:helix-turn-helix transcriptional regulator [Clostridia bacterium]